MVSIFHCCEFLLLRKLDGDSNFFNETKEKIIKGNENISPDLWFYAATIAQSKEKFRPFIKNLVVTEPLYIPSSHDTLLNRYLKHCDFVELHLDNVFKHGESRVLPKELFKCPNVEVLSLRSNFLDLLPPEIGQLQKLEYLALTNNRLENFSMPYSLVFCRRLSVLLLDNNLLDALPGFLLLLPNLTTVYRHGNHNYFQSTFMWYHTDMHERIVALLPNMLPPKRAEMQTLRFLCAKSVVAEKINFFCRSTVPQVLADYICNIYFDFNICFNCASANPKQHPGYKVFTFKNPYLGNTCVPFQHWACSLKCAKAIEFPAREEQLQSSLEQDMIYHQRIREAHEFDRKTENFIKSSCTIL